jgi:hypothetical protein
MRNFEKLWTQFYLGIAPSHLLRKRSYSTIFLKRRIEEKHKPVKGRRCLEEGEYGSIDKVVRLLDGE